MRKTFAYTLTIDGQVDLDLPEEEWENLSEDHLQEMVAEEGVHSYNWLSEELSDMYEVNRP